jgi:SAGA-associated factor 29
MKRFYTNTPHPIVESAQEMSGRNGTKPTVEEFMAKRQQFVTNLQTLQAQVEAQFQVGAEVLYRKGSSKVFDPNDGEGMLCRVTSVIGEGKQRRYLILDAGPDITDAPHRASLQQMMFIPPIGTVLPELKPKANVLALYPSTTTFYKAEVVTGRKKEGHEELAAGYVRLLFEGDVELLFEGEDDAELAKDVERRYVLLDWTVK